MNIKRRKPPILIKIKTLDKIIQEVADAVGCKVNLMHTATRERPYPTARYIVYFFLKKLLRHRSMIMAGIFQQGLKPIHHTVVLRGIWVIEDYMEQDADFKKKMDYLELRIIDIINDAVANYRGVRSDRQSSS